MFEGKVSRQELIFCGKIHSEDYSGQLINFTGFVRLKKTMHKCERLLVKCPGKPLMRTKEYIPTEHELTLISNSEVKHKI